jgi:hypothetical protein
MVEVIFIDVAPPVVLSLLCVLVSRQRAILEPDVTH